MNPWVIVAISLIGVLIFVLIAVFAGMLIYALRKQIRPILNRWALLREISLGRDETFTAEIRRRILRNGEQKTALYEKQITDLKEQLATERHERVIAQQVSSEFQLTLKELEIKTIEITTDALDIARSYADKLDPIYAELVEHRKETSIVNGELSVKLEALGFVIAQLAFRGQKGKSFEDLVIELGNAKNQEPGSIESS